MARQRRGANPLNRIPPARVVREELEDAQEKVRHLTALLELAERLDSSQDDSRKAANGGAVASPLSAHAVGGLTNAGAH